MTPVEVRTAHDDELELVAALRWRWVGERDGLPEAQRAPFVRDFTAWARAHEATHHCFVVLVDEQVAGTAFLATTARVPTPHSLTRASGDLQCVYVAPEARDRGLGGFLVEAALELAADLGLERVTVHSSERAVGVYQRGGFATSTVLLHTRPADRQQ
ncbi:GNAT family N-acetyltransferase [Actinomycetospora soli]|uniref:GNAT family N-acetyltransferase n=1 Tax=Actinomycetospora soli TaxID=2893887 RepID=UPI001E3882D1|nr:GNAT family N-acetyltransferase [Actinomycetospora soli]MCD2191694.1 GNAT family N-acetyltransferase [Actinomycetospora soli]